MPNDMVLEATMIGFAVLVISFVGIVAAIGWVGLVSIGIRREDRGAVINASPTDLSGVVPGKVARIARQTTGVRWV
jgi:hypothetical protein